MSDATARVVDQLVSDVAHARLAPGERLPRAAEIGRRFGVAPDAAVVAIRELARLGIVAPTDGGATVAAEAQWDVLDPRVLSVVLTTPKGPAILAEYLEYRRLIEVLAAGLAAVHATAADLSALSRALAEMTTAAGLDDAEAWFHRADVAFHHALLAAGGNRPLELAAATLAPALCAARRALARPELRRERGIPEHQRILAAVAQGDPDAARDAMAAHLDTVETYLREYADLARSR
jgi:GntR family transcriptional repressor for pyruvate dehydrogenase complex